MTTVDQPNDRDSMPVYQLFMLVLCVVAIVAIVAQHAVVQDPEMQSLLNYADLAICIAFGIDFLISLYRAPNKRKYFFTWGWLDLVSSIPMLDAARWGRLARIARIARLLRGLRAARILMQVVVERRRQSTLLAATLLATILIFAGALAILHFEQTAEGGNIRSAEDAIWWALATITTVGYGDRFPVTTGGRFIATLLMTAGVGLFGVVSAGLASWFLVSEQPPDPELARLREEVSALRKAIENREPKSE